MQLSEHKRHIKGNSFVKVMSMAFQSLFYPDLILKPEEESNKKRFFSHNQQPLMNENLSDYKYNRGLYR